MLRRLTILFPVWAHAFACGEGVDSVASPSTASRSPEVGADGSASGSAPQSSARAAAEIIAITTHDDFLLEIGAVLSGQTAVHPVDSVVMALEQLAGARRIQLVAIDARGTTDVRSDVERLNAQAPHGVVLVFANADDEKQTAAAIKGTSVFAVLPVPIDNRKTTAVLEGATAEALNRRPAPAHQRPAQAHDLGSDKSSSLTVETHTGSAQHAAHDDADSGGRKPLLLIGGGVLALLIAAGAAWYLMRGSAPAAANKKATISVSATDISEESVVAEPPPVVDMPLVNGTVDELLEKARLAMRERRYTEPNGDNALLYYRSASKVDPANGEATDGLKRVAAVLVGRFDESMAGARYEDAALAVAHLKIATPGDPAIAPLEAKVAVAQVSKMLAEGNVDRAAALVKGAQQSGAVPAAQIAKWRTEIGRRQDDAKQKRLFDLAGDRIRDGRLSEPDDDSAKFYLKQLQDMGAPAASAAQRVGRDLGNAYMKKAREAALANRNSESDRWLAEAKSIGVSNSELNGFQRDVVSAKQRAANAEADRLAGLVRDRLRDGKLTEPAQDSAAFYLATLQSADADNAAAASASRELATKLLARAGAAAREGKSAQVEADLTQARRWGADPKDIQAIQQASVGKANAPRTGGSTARRNDNDVPTLKRTRYVAPEYPERALAQRISGSVTIEFVVGTDGETRDVRVVAAEPVGTFDRVAVSAVKRWRYAPVPEEVETRTMIRFALPDRQP